MSHQEHVLGIDIGTGSARAGIFTQDGVMLAEAKTPIAMHRPAEHHVEQSSTNIWRAVCSATRRATEAAGVAAESVTRMSVSATCSLVLLDKAYRPLALSEGDEPWDIIVWMDHRATMEAAECTATGSKVLANLGGAMSPEMQMPKLKWLKRHRPELYEQIGYAGDLGDWLGFACTGSFERSVCMLACKWTFDPRPGHGWDHDFLDRINMADVIERARLPETALPVGVDLGPLTEAAAADLGLTTGCHFSVGMIDAYAGALGTLGRSLTNAPETRLAVIGGTSTCHIGAQPSRCEVPGVWGPYPGALCDGFVANEGGQSITGALLDHLVAMFAAGSAFGDDVHGELSKVLLERLESGDPAPHTHVCPDFIGNRSPLADPEIRGAITGLTLDTPQESFIKVYWAAATALVYGTRAIIERLNAHGYAIDTLHLSGGHGRSALLRKLYADGTGCRVVLSEAPEPVLLGAAVAALGAATKGDVLGVAKGLSPGEHVLEPDPAMGAMHATRYQAFKALYAGRLE
ncbi:MULTISPECIES: FGGY family pentulose kinase [unclassified Halomonas]|uniref:FGGY-family carbohydrate kinase n=1 Tax=unclassified Halomonas TaxID=2609666 RepID=UPI002076AE50|nr:MULTISPECIES: FGGY family pentulose kinase [unclassified Halomonas]